jgi:aspartate/methionine/tyrosine aminotransferase
MVMDVMIKAADIEGKFNDVMHLEVGQPATGAPKAASKAIADALDIPSSHGYTLAQGIEPLREGIARHYKRWYNLDVASHNVIVTVGSSLGFAMVFLGCFDNGDRVAITNPGYSGYRNLMTAVGIEPVDLPAGPEQGWIPQIKDLEAMSPLPDGVIIANPPNPTGVVIPPDAFARIVKWCHEKGVRLISDEIYHGVTYDIEADTALRSSSSAIVINSFSKFFSMTGHRVGWMILPDDLVDPMERLAQNCVISVPTLSQIAAAAAISSNEAIAEMEEHVKRYRVNRDILLDNLPEKFLGNVAPAEGAFYLYADTSQISDNSLELSSRLLDDIHVATTPGLDFDHTNGHLALRLSFAGKAEDMKTAAERITKWVKNNT